jgi:isochorismate hydrolase
MQKEWWPKTILLLDAARRMSIPILVSEQYPQGIGSTDARILSLLPQGCIVEKIHFSCLAEVSCRTRIAAESRAQVILTGTEAHVCVL